jgi:hypothetical protein
MVSWRIVIILATFLVSFQGCAPGVSDLKIENSMPQSELVQYNDTFDKMRADIWTKSALVHKKAWLSNFQTADFQIEKGKLKIETKTNCFSEGGFVFKHAFRGDFDIQIDCHIDFLSGKIDMDQVLVFGVVEKGTDLKDFNSTELSVFKKGESEKGILFTFRRQSGKMHGVTAFKLNRFHGTFRIIRRGNKAYTLYKLEQNPKWNILGNFYFTTNDAIVGYFLQNYVLKRTSITAQSSINALFDNFRINAAQEIVEEEI